VADVLKPACAMAVDVANIANKGIWLHILGAVHNRTDAKGYIPVCRKKWYWKGIHLQFWWKKQVDEVLE